MQKNHKLVSQNIPPKLQAIQSPPKQLFYSGPLEELLAKPLLAVVGSRKMSSYGRAVTEQLISEVARRGVVIISGLALGVDACAHKAALEAGGLTLAVLPTSLDNIQPQTNARLAKQIVEQGGALVTEYDDGTPIHRTYFVARNRLVSGLADAVLITEATEQSGTMHTAAYARQQRKPLLVVPGPINNPMSKGPNSLLKIGATPVTQAADILKVLGIAAKKEQVELIAASEEERLILELLQNGVADGHTLQQQSKLPAGLFNQTLTMLELAGAIKSLGNSQWSIS
jgi:DNA processing protein